MPLSDEVKEIERLFQFFPYFTFHVLTHLAAARASNKVPFPNIIRLSIYFPKTQKDTIKNSAYLSSHCTRPLHMRQIRGVVGTNDAIVF
jgi:hypothetical protein